ncbi:MAG: hypothetical protein IPK79_00960 [Vampirovibrionales bacterium]|nr:hypothetical protein [Vampirovibrionales bacterium]
MTEITSAAPVATTDAPPPPVTTEAPAPAAQAWAWPDDLKIAATAKGWDKLGDPAEALPHVARSYINAEKLLHTPAEKIVRLPDDPKAPGAFDKIYAALGRPETPDGYKLEKPADLPDDYPYDENLIKARLPVFHKLGLAPAAVQTLNEELHRANVEAMRNHEAEMAKRAQDGEATLRREWGPEYDTRTALADRAVSKYGGDEFRDWLKQYGFDADPTFRKMFAAIGRDTSEDGATPGGGAGAASAASEVDRLIADGDFQSRIKGKSGPEAQRQARAQWETAIQRKIAAGA